MPLSEDFYGIPGSDPDMYGSRDIAAIARRWDAKAARWDSDLNDDACHLNHEDAYRRFMVLARQLVVERREVCAAGSLVDLGCGTGAVLADLSPHFQGCIGIDVSREMLDAATAKDIRNAEWRLGDVFEGTWGGRKHAAVVSRGILLSHYGGDLARQLLGHAVGALIPGGFALFDFLAEDAPEDARILAPNKTYFRPGWLIDQAERLGSGSAFVAGSSATRIRYLILSG